ncbi:MAG: type II secretion system protein [Proteobacteria bacterium]|nr:type II secretion system protein [Pseudomonadota bacterium]
MWKQSKQSGFTLVELAIVLVIIGLILAAVLKGQEMINNAKVKNVANDLRGVSTAYYAYQDRYKAVPGDDILAVNHFTGGQNGGGDGLITGLFNDTAAALSATTESQNFWQHTRLAGFTTGTATATTALPPNTSLGTGVLGIQGSVAANVYGMTGTFACASNIPWKIALAVDTMLDDGNSDTGNVRTGAAGATATVAALSAAYGTAAATGTNDTLHIVCMKI